VIFQVINRDRHAVVRSVVSFRTSYINSLLVYLQHTRQGDFGRQEKRGKEFSDNFLTYFITY